MLLSIQNATDVDLAIDTISGTIGYFFLFFIIIKILDNLTKFYGFFLSITAVHLIIIFMNIDVLANPHTRSYLENLTFLGDGNDFALSVCITIPASLYLIATTKNKMLKYTCMAGFLILVLAVIGTQSRGASLTLMVMMLYYGLKSERKVRLLARLAPILLIVIIYAPSAYFARLENINNYQETSAQARITAWKVGVKMAMDHPFIGVGAGQFPFTYAARYPDRINQGSARTAHSTFFLALGELGFPGLIIIITFFALNLIRNERLAGQLKKISTEQDHTNHILLLKNINASILAFMVAGAFLSALYYPHIYLLAGVAGAGRLFITKQVLRNNKI
jgi:probable O-glycosylation ligase (exosortase A-associated)